MKDKKIPLFLYSVISMFYIELLFRAVTVEKFFSMSLINIVISCIIFSLVFSLLSKLFKSTANKIIYFSLIFIFSLFSIIALVYKNTFNVFFSFQLLKLADQVMTFWKDALGMALHNLVYIVLILVPFIALFFVKKYLNFEQSKAKKDIVLIILIALLIVFYKGTLLINKNKSYSAYQLTYKINDISLSIEKFGLYEATYLDIKKALTDFEESVTFTNVDDPVQKKKKPEIVYDYNIDKSIDFNSLIKNEKNKTVKQMHEYFNADAGTQQNKYTGFFKDKNLILIMAESFNEIAVSEKYTPTLYKLTTSGFVFNNFYTPVNNSTIGGEFQMLSGLFANGQLGTWRSGKNEYPYGIATLFQNEGYSTFAYHDHTYTFQDRNKYLKSIGFDNFKGCRNGLEKQVNCNRWPESDIEMINATFDDYINEDKFMVFYASVSGHGGYSWSGNSMSTKHKSEVADLNYSEPVKAYIAAQMEFDQALQLLIEKLDEAGKLQDTVIAFVGDHYPYMLSLDQVNEAASYEKDNVIEINHSNFVLWNSEMETIEIDKVGSQIDVLPTVYNVFGLPYDSRLFVGKDILSTAPGLAIFSNRSWVSDYGKYYSSSKKFVPTTDEVLSEDYVDNMNNAVSSKVAMSKNIIEYNYYKKVKAN